MFWRKLMTEPNLDEFINNPIVGQTFDLTDEEGEKDEATLICISDGASVTTDIPDELKPFLMMLSSQTVYFVM
jgi:hypothetical protein